MGGGKIKALDQQILVEKGLKIDAFIEKIGAGVPVNSDDVFDLTAQRHIDILQLPLEEEVIRRYKDEVFDDKPFQQHLNVRKLTLPKDVLAYNFRTFMDGDFSVNAPQTDLVQVAIFCEIMRRCVPDCSSVLQLHITLGSKDEVPIPEGVLDLWKTLVLNERLKQGKTTHKPETKKQMIQSLVKTAKRLFGDDFLKTEHTQSRINKKRTSESCYTVNAEWLDMQMGLFRYSADSQNDKPDVEIARRYGLLHALDYSNANTDATDQIHVCEPVDCSKTPEDSAWEQERSKEWADLAQRPPSSVQGEKPASGQKKPKRAQVSEKDRLTKMRANLRRCGVKPDF
jgi:hypothetical protein